MSDRYKLDGLYIIDTHKLNRQYSPSRLHPKGVVKRINALHAKVIELEAKNAEFCLKTLQFIGHLEQNKSIEKHAMETNTKYLNALDKIKELEEQNKKLTSQLKKE